MTAQQQLFQLVMEDNDQCAWEGSTLQHRLEQLNMTAQLMLNELFPSQPSIVQWSVTPDGSIVFRSASQAALEALAVHTDDPGISFNDVTEVTPGTPDPHSSPLTIDQQIVYLRGRVAELQAGPQPASGPRPLEDDAAYALDTVPAFVTIPAKLRFATEMNLGPERIAYYAPSA